LKKAELKLSKLELDVAINSKEINDFKQPFFQAYENYLNNANHESLKRLIEPDIIIQIDTALVSEIPKDSTLEANLLKNAELDSESIVSTDVKDLSTGIENKVQPKPVPLAHPKEVKFAKEVVQNTVGDLIDTTKSDISKITKSKNGQEAIENAENHPVQATEGAANNFWDLAASDRTQLIKLLNKPLYSDSLIKKAFRNGIKQTLLENLSDAKADQEQLLEFFNQNMTNNDSLINLQHQIKQVGIAQEQLDIFKQLGEDGYYNQWLRNLPPTELEDYLGDELIDSINSELAALKLELEQELVTDFKSVIKTDEKVAKEVVVDSFDNLDNEIQEVAEEVEEKVVSDIV
jgi:hypothetical protein